MEIRKTVTYDPARLSRDELAAEASHLCADQEDFSLGWVKDGTATKAGTSVLIVQCLSLPGRHSSMYLPPEVNQ